MPACAGPAPDEVEAAASEGSSRGLSVVGTWHAHPDASAEPTAEDSAGLRPGGLLLLISVRNGQADEWACWTILGGACEPVIVRLASR
jgi:proteasome lid subunit RPN8/RPN11